MQQGSKESFVMTHLISFMLAKLSRNPALHNITQNEMFLFTSESESTKNKRKLFIICLKVLNENRIPQY